MTLAAIVAALLLAVVMTAGSGRCRNPHCPYCHRPDDDQDDQ